MNSFAAAMTMMLRRQKGRYAALTMATLIACSRLYLMVHYPTDVAAGALIGTASAWFSGKVADRTAEKRKRRRLNG
jgi:undecaprenyl-diphosphatase